MKTAFDVAKPSVVSKILTPSQEYTDIWRQLCWHMMWADNHWLFSDNREKLTCMVNDIIEELLDLDHGAQAGITVVDKYTQT